MDSGIIHTSALGCFLFDFTRNINIRSHKRHQILSLSTCFYLNPFIISDNTCCQELDGAGLHINYTNTHSMLVYCTQTYLTDVRLMDKNGV